MNGRTRGWRDRMKKAAGASAAGLRRIAGDRSDGRFGVLLYHRISPVFAGVCPPTLNVTPGRFRQQLAGLLAAGYRFASLQHVLQVSRRGDTMPDRTIVLTFDDGFESVYVEAWPVLRELQIPATVFLATAYMDGDDPFAFDSWGRLQRHAVPPVGYRPLRWWQCHELREDGRVEFGAHTHTHADFRGRPDALESDLSECVRQLERRFGSPDVSFAFPFGKPSLGYVDDQQVAAARRTGVSCGLTTEDVLVRAHSDPFRWGRFNVYEWDTPTTLAGKLAGWYSWMPRLVDCARQIAPTRRRVPSV